MTDIDLDKDRMKVRKWLDEEVKLGEYFVLFMNHGFNDLETVMELNEDHLKEMGIDKVGHRIKILKHTNKG